MSTFTDRVRVERALLAIADPAGEAEAIVPLGLDAAMTVVRRPVLGSGAVRGRGPAAAILEAIGAAPGRTSGVVRCPAHEDRHPSLSWRLAPSGRVLMHCFAGCPYEAVLKAVAGE